MSLVKLCYIQYKKHWYSTHKDHEKGEGPVSFNDFCYNDFEKEEVMKEVLTDKLFKKWKAIVPIKEHDDFMGPVKNTNTRNFPIEEDDDDVKRGYFAHIEDTAPDGSILIKRVYITENGDILDENSLENYCALKDE